MGDGGQPPGLDVLVLGLGGAGIASAMLWWRSTAPVADAFWIPLLGSFPVLYFFWKGKNWARVLLWLGSIVELVGVVLAYAFVRSRMTRLDMVALGLRLVADLWVIAFSLRPDVAIYFEQGSSKSRKR